MYRIAEEVENYFYGCSWTKYQQQCLLFGENILRLFRTCANIACKNSGGKKKDQITANISGRTVTPSVCMR